MKNLISIFLAFLFLASGVAFARGKEEIAVAARGKVPQLLQGKGIKAVSFKGSAEEAVKKVLKSS